VQSAHTLVLHYRQRFAFAPLYLPYAAPRHAWGNIPNKDLFNRDDVNLYPNVTSGPFMVDSYAPGQRITMKPNPYYRSTTLHHSVLGKLIFTAYPDVDSLISAFQAGQTDYAQGFDVKQDLLKIAGVPGYNVAQNMGYDRLNFNLSQPALQSYEVRKAIEEALDRCGLILQVFLLDCKDMRVDTIVPPPSPDYDPNIKTYGYDLAQARQDMQIAGWNCPGGGTCTREGQSFPPLRLAIRNDQLERVQMAAFIKQSLEALGIPVTLQLYPPDVFFSDYDSGGILATGQYDLAIWGDLGTGLDDDLNFSTYFDSSQIPSASNTLGQNYSRVHDSLIDADLAAGRVTLDPKARVQIYRDLEQELAQRVIFVPLHLGLRLALVNPTIGNFYDNPLDFPEDGGPVYQGNGWNFSDWFLTR
jgi:ABC-type transport system substrate-binding protein